MIDSFRQHKKESIISVLSGYDTIVLKSTGGGKSLIHQIVGVYNSMQFNKISVIITPLLCLIQDQVKLTNEMFPDSSIAINSAISILKDSVVAVPY